jgi:hypothetical protein
VFIWMKFIHIGDLRLMLPTGFAIAAYLAVIKEWRIARFWFVLLCICTGFVTGSKIAYLGWGYGIPAINFKALSGHAAFSAAIIPSSIFVLLQSSSAAIRKNMLIGGFATAALLGVFLVLLNEHTVSEAIAGFLVGACISTIFILRSHISPATGMRPWIFPFILIVLLSTWYWLEPPVEFWMMQAAMQLSGHTMLYAWIK